MDAADDDYAWPDFDENTASALCYTSGTTGRPKGVLYSHRSTVLHAYAIALPDVLRPARHQPHPAGRADVPRQCLGHSVCHRADRCGAGAAGSASRWRQPRATAQPGARDADLRRADRLARPAAASARQRREAGDGEAHHDRRLGRAAAADRGIPRRVRRRRRAWLGHDGTQPGRHLQCAEAGAGRPRRRAGACGTC